MVEIKEFVVNIIGQDVAHYVKASMSLELDREATLDEVNKRMPQIRDAILLLIGNKTYEELQDIQGKNQVKAEVKSRINSFLRTGKVNNVYLTDFVVQ
jgi:flagellar FliL protein